MDHRPDLTFALVRPLSLSLSRRSIACNHPLTRGAARALIATSDRYYLLARERLRQASIMTARPLRPAGSIAIVQIGPRR